jgi:hypothetical protein
MVSGKVGFARFQKKDALHFRFPKCERFCRLVFNAFG